MYEEIAGRDTAVIAVSQEDTEVDASHYEAFLRRLEPGPYFEVLVDANRAATGRYERTTAYLLDREGVVRQIFPMIIHARPTWEAFLPELERLNAGG